MDAMSMQNKVGDVVAVEKGWQRGVRWALLVLAIYVVISAITVVMFDRYFMPGLVFIGVVFYFYMGCELKVASSQEDIERVLQDKKYVRYQDGCWGLGAIPYILSDKFSIVSDVDGVRLEGGRATLKKVARALNKSR